VKTAFFGEDGNWGRIMCSIGYSEGSFDIDKVTVFIGDEETMLKIVEEGQGTDYKEEDIAKILKHKNLKVLVDLHAGEENAKGWGCDLSYEYVKINGAYRS
jgi:glutamate N-acetyltransferase/amino-acid N-acetyltransferase